LTVLRAPSRVLRRERTPAPGLTRYDTDDHPSVDQTEIAGIRV
jgi:hypothetical protein